MGTPGQALRDSIANLGAAMRAAKATSEEVKERIANRESLPPRIGREETDERDSDSQSAA